MAEEHRALVLDAGAAGLEQFPGQGPEPFGMLGDAADVPGAAAVDPIGPCDFREILAGHPQLVGQQVLHRHGKVIEGGAEAMADHGVGVVQDRAAHQPALQAEIEVFHAPIPHVRIEAAQVLVEFAADGQRAADQGRGDS